MRFTEEAASLVDLIMDAYQVRRFQIAGVPNWGDTGQDVYDIAAKFPEGQTPTLEMRGVCCRRCSPSGSN
jgi:uncharacterized protein (TIGR03435 family)